MHSKSATHPLAITDTQAGQATVERPWLAYGRVRTSVVVGHPVCPPYAAGYIRYGPPFLLHPTTWRMADWQRSHISCLEENLSRSLVGINPWTACKNGCPAEL